MFLDLQEVRDIVAYYVIVFALYLQCIYIEDWTWAVIVCLSLYLLPILLPDTSLIRLVTCGIVAFLATFSLSCLYVVLFSLSPFHPQNLRYLEYPSEIMSRIMGIQYEFHNLSALEKYKKAIVILNHQSIIDTFIVVKLWKLLGSPRVIVKREAFFYLPVGLASWLCGVIFVEKMVGPKARMHFMTQAKNHLNGPHERPCILMFPEGKRNGNKTSLLPFRKGAFRLAADMKIPIVPIVVSPLAFLDDNILGRGKAVVTVLDPITEETFTKCDNLDEAIKHTWDLMNRAYTTPPSDKTSSLLL